MECQALAACIQMNSGDDRQANYQQAARLMEEAVDRGACLLLLPENFAFMGADEAVKRQMAEDPDASPSIDFLQHMAQKLGVWIVGGSIHLAKPGEERFTNSCLLFDDTGQERARYDKIHLFDVDLGGGNQAFRESSLVRPGRAAVTVDTPYGRVGLSICYDLRFPELYRNLVMAGAEILVVPSAFTMETGKDHWELLLRARAVENFAYVLAAGQTGRHPGGRRTHGHSMIIEPWGTVVAQQHDEPGVALARLDPERLQACRARIPALDHRIF